MSFNVFLSHSMYPEESAVVWRVQMLAALEGVHVFVPPRPGKNASTISGPIRNAIDRSDCVLVIVTSGPSPAMQKELSYASEKKKLIVAVAEKKAGFSAPLKKVVYTFGFSRSDENPAHVAGPILDFLKHEKLYGENRQTLRAIIAIFLGLLHLSRLAKE